MKKCIRFLIAMTFASQLSAFAEDSKATSDSKTYKKLEILAKVLSYVETNYIEPVKTEELVSHAISGMLSELDPHTAYLPPSRSKEMKEDTSGEFGGVGIEVTVKDGYLTVVSPIDDSPAEKAGLLAGDQIVQIDGKTTKGMTLEDAVKLMRGPNGSKISLSVLRQGLEKAQTYVIRRQQVGVQSVQAELLDKNYGYIRIKAFQNRTDRELEKHLANLKKQSDGPLKGILLDLRNNPGGLLNQAVRVADQFLTGGVIVTTKGRDAGYEETQLATKDGNELDVPMITLVNGGSASAAEIVAGALQDHRRSVVLGTRSFGKGSVQTIIDLDDGSALKLTIARYYTPNGRSIQAEGINPDITVGDQVELTRDRLSERDLKRHIDNPNEAKTPVAPINYKYIDMQSDVQAGHALEYLKTWEVFKHTVEAPVIKVTASEPKK